MWTALAPLLPYLRPHWRKYLLGVGALAVCDVGQLAIPWLIGTFIDRLGDGSLDQNGLWRFAGLIVALAVCVALFRFVWRIFIFGTARRIEFEIRNHLFTHFQRLSASFYHRRKVGDLMAHATNDLQAVRAVAGEGVMAGWDAIGLSIGTLAIMVLAIDARLTLAAFLPLPLLALVQIRLGRLIHERFKDVQAAFASLSDRAQENLSGIRVVKAFVQEDAQRQTFARANDLYLARFIRMTRVQGAVEPIISLLAGTGTLVCLAYGGSLVLAGELSLGKFVAFNSYIGMLVWPMIGLGWALNLAQRAAASMERLQALFVEVPEIADAPDALTPGTWQGHISIRNLSFRYAPELPEVLHNVSVELPPGKTLGIVGRTGSGKTTLADLLVRMADPPPGAIAIDGVDIRQLSLQALRGAVSYVPQDAFLFSKTIARNIAFTPEERSEDQIMDASRLAQLDGDVQDFPDGYETMLGERGITLSGGQRQRVSIARALIKDGPILVLDDCLSAVDTATESRILAALRPYMGQRTTIIISHRVSAVQHANEILVLDRGCVIERGTHLELLGAEGAYRQMWDRQQLEASIEEAS